MLDVSALFQYIKSTRIAFHGASLAIAGLESLPKSDITQALSLPCFIDCGKDFPIFKSDNSSIDWKREAHKLYKLPKHPVPISHPTPALGTLNFSYPCARFTQEIKTKNIFQDSQAFYGIDLREHARNKISDIKAKVDKLPPTVKRQEAWRRALTRSANHLYQEHRDFPLNNESLYEKIRELIPYDKETNRFKQRSSGFKYALRLYFNNLKNYQPHLYNLCLAAAKKLKTDSPNRPKAFSTIAVHQSETNLKNLLSELDQQNFDKKTCPIFLFVNGNDDSKIDERLREIDEFKREHPDLDIRIIAGRLDTWRYGLKAIPYITALMTIAMSATEDDSDLASIFFDADIIRFLNEQHLDHFIGAINEGWIKAASALHCYDPNEISNNKNYLMLALVDELISRNVESRHAKCNLNMDDFELTKDGSGCSGGNSVFSTIVNLLAGATAAHTNHEDIEWSQRATSLIARSYQEELSDAQKYNKALIRPNPLDCGVICDGGHLQRAAEIGRPILEVWDCHDNIRGDLPPISENDENLNLERYDQELAYIYKKILGYAYKGFRLDKGSGDDCINVLKYMLSIMQWEIIELFMPTIPALSENSVTLTYSKTDSLNLVIYFSSKSDPDIRLRVTKDGIEKYSCTEFPEGETMAFTLSNKETLQILKGEISKEPSSSPLETWAQKRK